MLLYVNFCTFALANNENSLSMLFAIIFSIFTTTFSVISTTEVQQTGDIPPYAEYQYTRSSNTGQRGQMTKGNYTHLRLQGWEGCRIRAIKLQMRSNTASGSGWLRTTIGDSIVWQIANASFEDVAWAGEYTNQWVDIETSIDVTVGMFDNIDIHIAATENSLYINSYTIVYEPNWPDCYTLTFVTGLYTTIPSITQAYQGAPIALPALPDTAIWQFIGWSAQEIMDSQQCGAIMPPAYEYLPKGSQRLYAVYADGKEPGQVQAGVDGDYLMLKYDAYTEWVYGPNMAAALAGEVDDNHLIATKPIPINPSSNDTYTITTTGDSSMIYTLYFISDSTLVIQHYATQTNVGCEDGQLTDDMTLWHYSTLDDGSIAIYDHQRDKDFTLYIGAGPHAEMKGVWGYAQQLKVEQWKNGAICLFPAITRTYTSWPFGKYDAVFTPQANKSNIYQLQMGIYQLLIKDGEKFLQLR